MCRDRNTAARPWRRHAAIPGPEYILVTLVRLPVPGGLSRGRKRPGLRRTLGSAPRGCQRMPGRLHTPFKTAAGRAVRARRTTVSRR